MSHKYWGKFSWSARRESADECAARFFRLLRTLKTLGRPFAKWTILNATGRPSQFRGVSLDSLAAALRADRNRDDVKHAVIDDLGYGIFLTSGGVKEPGFSIDANVGCYANPLRNVVLFHAPPSNVMPDVVNYETMRAVIEAGIDAFEPELAYVTSEECDRLLSNYGSDDFVIVPGQPDAGWLNYLKKGYWPLPKLPSGCECEELPNRGYLITTTRELFDVENPQHLRRVKKLQKNILQAKKIAKLPPALRDEESGPEMNPEEFVKCVAKLAVDQPPSCAINRSAGFRG